MNTSFINSCTCDAINTTIKSPQSTPILKRSLTVLQFTINQNFFILFLSHPPSRSEGGCEFSHKN